MSFIDSHIIGIHNFYMKNLEDTLMSIIKTIEIQRFGDNEK